MRIAEDTYYFSHHERVVLPVYRIVLDDADIGKAVKQGVMQMMTNSGQSCNAPSRMFVPRSKNDEAKAIAKLARLAAASPLWSSALSAQLDPRPLSEHKRTPGLDEMTNAFDFEPVMFANVPLTVYDYTAHGDGSDVARSAMS